MAQVTTAEIRALIPEMQIWDYDRERRRVHICGARIHHGLVGAVLFTVGVILMADDLHDIPWMRDD
jgi:hypothetical protein